MAAGTENSVVTDNQIYTRRLFPSRFFYRRFRDYGGLVQSVCTLQQYSSSSCSMAVLAVPSCIGGSLYTSGSSAPTLSTGIATG